MQLEALICMTAPNDDAHIAISAKLDIPVFLYQLDPFYSFGDTVHVRNKSLFIKYLKRFSAVFTTQLLMQEYQHDEELLPYLTKISVLQFPKIREHTDQSGQLTSRKRLLYAGTLYAGRNHRFLIDLKRMLPENYDIVFCGNCDNNSNMEELKESGIICLGYCDPSKLENEISTSSMLINIGNIVHNQLPSKVIDYISTGKPIINIFQIDACPSLDVLKDYKYCLSIKASDLLSMKETVQRFCLQYAEARMPWASIKELYREYTPEYVSGIILKKIKDTVKH